MITKNTVFILGAGASQPYGFPTGKPLCSQIINSSDNKNIFEACLNRFRKSSDEYDLEKKEFTERIHFFQEKLRASFFESIDTFLENNPDFMSLGKIFIAHILIKSENPESIIYGNPNWYSYLWQHCMLSSFEELQNNKISFITFNYDRSLEFFFHTAVKHGFSRSDAEVIQVLSNFKIFHFYGSLGSLPWQESSGYDYSSNHTLIDRYRSAIDSLHLVGKDRTKNFEMAYNLIKKAERVVFLGFGYNKENLDRLEIKLMEGKEVWGSAYGLEEAEKRAVQGYFRARDILITLGEKEDDALSFLRKNFDRQL